MQCARRSIISVGAAFLAASPIVYADEAAALRALAQGGHALLVRHAQIGAHAKALVLDPNGNCANEENLSDEGRAQAERQARTKAITELLARHAGKGNVALVSHRPNIDALTLELIEEGEAIVTRIQPGGELDVIGRIKP